MHPEGEILRGIMGRALSGKGSAAVARLREFGGISRDVFV
jgi:hypothetical protein